MCVEGWAGENAEGEGSERSSGEGRNLTCSHGGKDPSHGGEQGKQKEE